MGPRNGGPEEPWIETRGGGLFFLNALLVFPHVMVLVPIFIRLAVRGSGRARGPSAILDTFPTIAEYLLPPIGPLLLLPIALAVYNWRIEPGRWPRAALTAFLVVHGAFLVWGVGTLIGWFDGELPGGPD